ncbi:MAG: sugar transferase [Pseudomonadota bacterium]|nr:sugar transferase [Pseudomonadota bacterium]
MTYAFYKRILDIAISFPALLLLSPIFLLIAIAIMLESPGSPFFLQERAGLHGHPFRIIKFRSMIKNASSIGPWQTATNDPRIIHVGKFLRISSLDELPQLWNVLVGDMSLVGPRPEVPARKPAYRPADWQARHRVRPGITGLAQVSGRSNLSEAIQLRYDLTYAAHPTLIGDVIILFKTLWIVLCRTGTN